MLTTPCYVTKQSLLHVFFLRVVSTFLSYNLFWRTRILRAFATVGHTVVVTALRPPPAYISADDLDRAVGACTLLVCLCCNKNNASKRLEHLPFRNHFHMTPTRRTLCLTQHLYPRALPAQHPQRPCPRLQQDNGQAPQIVMLVVTRKNTNCHLPHPLYEHSRA